MTVSLFHTNNMLTWRCCNGFGIGNNSRDSSIGNSNFDGGIQMMGGDLMMAWDALSVLIVTGFMIGIVIAVVVGAVRIGWALAPWIFGAAALLWLFGG